MKPPLKYSILFLCFAAAGYLTYDIFFTQSLSQLKSDNTVFVSNSLTGQFSGLFMFCITLGSIPLLYLLVSLIAKLQSKIQSIVVYSIIIGSGFAFWQLRINYLNGQIEPMSASLSAVGIQNHMGLGNLKLSHYVLFGLISGAIVSSGVFKLINRSKK